MRFLIRRGSKVRDRKASADRPHQGTECEEEEKTIFRRRKSSIWYFIGEKTCTVLSRDIICQTWIRIDTLKNKKFFSTFLEKKKKGSILESLLFCVIHENCLKQIVCRRGYTVLQSLLRLVFLFETSRIFSLDYYVSIIVVIPERRRC